MACNNAPKQFYRVQDDYSATHFDEESGFRAKRELSHSDFNRMVRYAVRQHEIFSSRRQRSENVRGISTIWDRLEDHLNWACREPSPFISVYSNLDIARKNANLRILQGKTNVFIAYIDLNEIESWSTRYREVVPLIRSFGLNELDVLVEPVRNNAKFEYVFVGRIPEEAVVGCEYWDKISV